MNLPCEKCLKYAICKTKQSIECDDLQSAFDRILFEMKEIQCKIKKANDLTYLHLDARNKAWSDTWVEIRKTFPRIKTINVEQKYGYGV